MKKLLLTGFVTMMLNTLWAQDCKTNLYMTKNAKLEMTIYDKKGEVSGKQHIQITDVKKTGNDYESSISNSMEDKKGKAISNGTGIYKCNGGMLSADMKMSMPQEQVGKMGDGEAKFEPVYLEYPASPTVGSSLKDAEFKMDVSMKSGVSVSMNFKQENRKVSARESITSPAGTWDAYVITYDGSMKTKMAGIGLPAFSFSVKEWYVPGTGIVKTETYSKGKLAGSTLLTAIAK